MDADTFIDRWSGPPISERAHYQTFVSQLCEVIDVGGPDRDRAGDLNYCFERPVRFRHDDGGSHVGYIDCYRRGCFVLEAKQSAKGPIGIASGDRVDRLMRAAKRQAADYAKALDEWPPFLVVVDVGRSIELWSDFDRQGKVYSPFPDRARQRITLDRMADPEVRDMLPAVWLDPMSLDPAARVAAVTTDIAERLGWLVRSIAERMPGTADGPISDLDRGAHANRTALFMMQCIFAMFADSVGLIEDRGFLEFLISYRGQARNFHTAASDYFRHMDSGGHCPAARQDLRRFNGGLFREVAPLPITEAELEALIAAAQADWASVEPAIFGALLEQALDPSERGRSGAHYTPRAFVERLVGPVLQPLRKDWEAIEGLAIGLHQDGRSAEAQKLVRGFHADLCALKILDPACGTGNFLYVSMHLLKTLESEVLSALHELGDPQGMLELPRHSVAPEQFLGLEQNRYAAWIAQMVLWIGHLQWHFRTFGDAKPSEPILRDAGSIQLGDAILSCDAVDLARDDQGRVVTRQRRATRNGSVQPEDENVEVERYINPRQTPWPEADFIVGNPPFMGAKDMRRHLGDGYVDALWAVRQGRHRSADLVTVWWDRAAELLTRPGSRLRRFGFITTSSITQTFSRRVIEDRLNAPRPVRLVYAVPDHPWIKGVDKAAVRIAMTVAEAGDPDGQGCLAEVVQESDLHSDLPQIVFRERVGDIGCNLSIIDGPAAVPLRANAGLSARGVQLMGAGFAVTPARADALCVHSAPVAPSPARPYRNGRDLAGRSRDLMAIDFHDLDEREARRLHPGFYDHLLTTVKAARDRNGRKAYRDRWWQFGEPRRELRAALAGLDRYIVTIETAKHRWFQFLDVEILPDNKLVVIATDDAAVLGVLSSRAHLAWFRSHCGRIGAYDGDAVYVKSACFDAFPFPDLSVAARAEVAALAEELQEVRERALLRDPTLTMTTLYNAITRAGPVADDGRGRTACVELLRYLHARLNDCVEKAYGWSDSPEPEVLVDRLRALNASRAAEEALGDVRHLRPAFQKRIGPATPVQQSDALFSGPAGLPDLPSKGAPLAAAILASLRGAGRPMTSHALLGRFSRRAGRRAEARVAETLSILAVAGSVQQTEGGWFAPR
jgi:hypothetical protein